MHMGKTDWIKQLQHILDCPIEVATMSAHQWSEIARQDHGAASQSGSPHPPILPGQQALSDGRLRFVADASPKGITVLEIDRRAISDKESELIGWTLRQIGSKEDTKAEAPMSDSEMYARKLGDWIQKQLESDEPAYSLPDHLIAGTRMYHEMIPFLLVTEQNSPKGGAYGELEKLLRSFLSEDILLIPLKSQEWLIWGPASLLRDEEADTYESAEEETVEDSLASIVSALHEMLASEWLGECHLAVAHPAMPAQGIIEMTILLRETINLGRKFHVGTNIHLPWMLQLERLLNAIPEVQRAKYLEQSLKRTDLFVESEMLATLETFFALDCNVSETAKKLYIHRNTLLYRLDKLKQETGLDVRQFRDAVLVKIILLLYKVTKRN